MGSFDRHLAKLLWDKKKLRVGFKRQFYSTASLAINHKTQRNLIDVAEKFLRRRGSEKKHRLYGINTVWKFILRYFRIPWNVFKRIFGPFWQKFLYGNFFQISSRKSTTTWKLLSTVIFKFSVSRTSRRAIVSEKVWRTFRSYSNGTEHRSSDFRRRIQSNGIQNGVHSKE